MKLDVKIPSPGESVNEVTISVLNKNNGDYVEKDEILFEIESDKATLTIPAEAAGKVLMQVEEGDTIPVGTVACQIDTSQAKETTGADSKPAEPSQNTDKKEGKAELKTEKAPEETIETETVKTKKIPSIAAEKIIAEKQINPDSVTGTGKDGRITKQDVANLKSPPSPTPQKEKSADKLPGQRTEESKKITPLRKKIAERLVQVKNETAMLTTFNEVDMSAVMTMRKKYQDQFVKKFGIKLGFMSFFSKAAVLSLEKYPEINAYFYDNQIHYHHYVDLGISVSAPKGLVVPVIRNAEMLQFHELELKIMELAQKARDLTISIDEMKGGTFTITNGGVFGSLMSTPILNPPQSGILGMHNIVERPIAVDGKVEIRPMMYVALSYDHRIVDGKSSVSFLKNIKELIEAPEKMLLNL